MGDNRELYKQFDREWKEKNQTKYVVWLLCYAVSIIPILVGFFAIVTSGGNEKSMINGLLWILLGVMLDVVAAVLNMGRKKEWKEYLRTHQNNGAN